VALAFCAPPRPPAASPLSPALSRVRPSAVRMGVFDGLFGRRKEEEEDRLRREGALARPRRPNKYFDALANVSAPELVQSFAETAPPEVQQAVKATVASLFGNVPEDAFEASVMSSGQSVASLMYSMQMTGYMFRNAQYRLSLRRSLERTAKLLPGEGASGKGSLPQVVGKVTVDIGGRAVEVDAAAYVADLHAEVKALTATLEEARASAGPTASPSAPNLLAYMQQMPREEVQSLASSVSPEVMECMQLLVEAVLTRDVAQGAAAIVEGPSAKLRELLVWQLVTGYKLRDLEARDTLAGLLPEDSE